MPRGRQTRVLRQDQIDALETFRRSRHEGAPSGYSLPQLRSALDLGCSWETLQKALQGLPVWDLHHSRIVAWIERYLKVPASAPAARDGKAAAAGDSDEDAAPMGDSHMRSEDQVAGDAEETPGATRTVRGSR